MTEPRIYMDHNATSPVRPEAARAVARALMRGGNPSSVHAEGRKARALIEEAREEVAALVGGQARNVIFTSGATEALNLALTPSLQAGHDKRPWRLFVSATEHAAVLGGHRFPVEDVEKLPVGADGVIDLAALAQALDAHPDSRPLLALQLANNETGVIQPVAEAAKLVHARDGLLVCDAVQAAGKIPVDMFTLGADLMAVSAHKIGGPSGVGALIRADEGIHIAEAMVRGGGQEKGIRSGTENMPGIAGFAAAATAARSVLDGEATRLGNLLARLESRLREIDAGTVIFGAGAARLPNTVLFSMPGLSAETALIALDLAGFAVSSGSACFSGKTKSSHVLEAMGVGPDIAKGMLRVSLGWTTRDHDIDQFIEAVQRLRANSAAAGKVLAA
jgi:cysteine desulfurase